MFGINDNQKNAPEPVQSPPDDGVPLPPSPFMVDNDAPSMPPGPSAQDNSAPALPELPPISNEPPPAITTNHSAPAPTLPAHDSTEPNQDALINIKSQALTNLAPLVGHLDQSPEEKFKTTMMLIQASDNADLVKVAYEIANQITDEKVKAQALLDVVNEINYFTQKGKDNKKP